MIEKQLTTQELVNNMQTACMVAITGTVPLDILHMMSVGCHLRWGMYGEKFGVMNMNNVAVLQNEKTGNVIVFEARPEGDTVFRFNYNPVAMKAFYDQGKK